MKINRDELADKLADVAIKALIVIIVGTILFFIYSLIFSESTKRSIKSFESNFGGGLNRSAVLYSYDGKQLDTWNGKFDIRETAGQGGDNCRTFDIEGKRNIVCGGIFVVKEK